LPARDCGEALPDTGSYEPLRAEAAILTELAIIFVLILANGFFAGAEIAVVAVRKTRLRELADAGSSAAKTVLALRNRPERFLATVQVGITVVSAAAAAYGGASIAARLHPLLAELGLPAPYALDLALGVVIIGVSYFSIVLGELVPKSLALRSAERYALLVGDLLKGLSWLATPVVWFLTTSSNLVLKPFGDQTTFTEARHSAEELQQLVEEATRAGTVDSHAGGIASRALDLPSLTAAEVMVPRQEVISLRRHAPAETVRRVLLEHTHTRMPVLEGAEDQVVGYVNVKDLLAVAWEQQLIVLEDVMRPAQFVPATATAVAVLKQMQAEHNPFAIVVDEHGAMLGIVTLEDLLEELVGEIFDEHVGRVPQKVRRHADGSAIVAGAAPIREVNRDLSLELPESGDFNTVAGLCLALAKRIPQPGESFALPDGTRLEVVDASPRRVRSVRVVPPGPRATG
jgi:putative hemolysin